MIMKKLLSRTISLLVLLVFIKKSQLYLVYIRVQAASQMSVYVGP